MRRIDVSLWVAVCLLLSSVGIGIYTDVRSIDTQRIKTAIDARLLRVQILNEAINNTLATTLFEENILRSANYLAQTDQLDQILREIRGLTAGMRMAAEAERLAQESERLQATRDLAIMLMNEERWLQARELLSSEEYLRARKISEISSELAITAVTSEVSEMSLWQERQRLGALWLILVAVLLLLWIGYRHSVGLRAQAGEQNRLREALAQANQELERRVEERTAQLREANERLEQLSMVDGLSGLANRRKFDQMLEQVWQRAKAEATPVALVMLDLDEFKAYNDLYGHQAGDACIQALARVLLSRSKRQGELAARYGGEEFALILPSYHLNAAQKAAESVRLAFAGLGLMHASSSCASVATISLGVAALIPGESSSVVDLIWLADQALYEAKHTGRNKVCVATGTDIVPTETTMNPAGTT